MSISWRELELVSGTIFASLLLQLECASYPLVSRFLHSPYYVNYVSKSRLPLPIGIHGIYTYTYIARMLYRNAARGLDIGLHEAFKVFAYIVAFNHCGLLCR